MKKDRALRRFFAAFLQSQVGTGAAYVALLLVAYQRLHSAWAISLVLLGEFVPGIVLAPLFGSLADRVSRRRLAISGDLLRAAAFIALALIPSFGATVALALLAGVGSAMFRPAINAALPGMVPAADRSRLIALFYASVNIGMMIGPALAAAALVFASAEELLLVNGLTFIVSGLLLAGVDLGPRSAGQLVEADDADGESVWAQTLEGARAVLEIPGVLVVLVVGGLVVLTGAMFNVFAPLLATGPLHAGGTGYCVLWALYGTGMVVGSFVNARAGSEIAVLRRRWLFGIALSGLAMTAAAIAPDLAFAMVGFMMVGLAENLLVGPETRLVQELVAERLLGRVFGLKDVLENVAFVCAFLGAGALLTLAGVRAVFVAAGLATVALAIFGALAFRIGSTSEGAAPEPAFAPSE